MQSTLTPEAPNGAQPDRRGSRLRNGGFPEPRPGEPAVTVASLHSECGAETRVRLPATVGEDVVRRVVCGGCGKRYRRLPVWTNGRVAAAEPAVEPSVPDHQLELAFGAPGATTPDLLGALTATPAPAAIEAAPAAPRSTPLHRRPQRTLAGDLATVAGKLGPGLRALRETAEGLFERVPGSDRLRRLDPRLARPIAAVATGLAVLAGLSLVQGSGDPPAPQPRAAGPSPAANARFLKRPTYSLAIPRGWRTARPEGGASLRIVSAEGSADAILWVERDTSLSFKTFERRSLRHLKTLAPNARVYQRLNAPTGDASIVQLRADIPSSSGSSPYLVTLRAAGPYRYYLATSVEPDAPAAARRAAALIHGSFLPEGKP